MCVEVLQLRTLPLGADNLAPPGADNPPLPLPKQAQAPEGGRNIGRTFWPGRIIRSTGGGKSAPPALPQGASPREGAEFGRTFRPRRIILPSGGRIIRPP